MKVMPKLADRLEREIELAVEVPFALDRVRFKCNRDALVVRELTQSRRLLVYEGAYLQMFLAWETFLEETFMRFLCGYVCPGVIPNLVNPAFPTLGRAERDILGSRDYVSWTNPVSVVTRSRKYISGGTHELVFASNSARLDAMNSVRNRIAHRSEASVRYFHAATMGEFSGKRYPASSAGRFLSDMNPSVRPPRPWIATLADEFVNLARQIAP